MSGENGMMINFIPPFSFYIALILDRIRINPALPNLLWRTKTSTCKDMKLYPLVAKPMFLYRVIGNNLRYQGV
jgi:hypothetical protein